MVNETNYDEDQVSLIRDKGAVMQSIDFAGLVSGNVSPTDFDSVFEVDDEILILTEIKRKGNALSTGQALAYTRVVDAWVRAGLSRAKWGEPKIKRAVFIFASHTVYDTSKSVMAAQCVIERVYTPNKEGDGRWTDGKDLEQKDLKSLLNRIGTNWKCPKIGFK